MENRKIRFGIVGTGKIVEWMLAGASRDARFEATAIYSRTEERAHAFASSHGIRHCFTSIEQMAASGLVDAVYVASPNCCHAGQSIVCMEHGLHVLCEKPLAGNAREVRQMIAAARRNDVTLMEAMVSTLSPNFAVVRRQLPRVGTVRRYVASYCQYSSRYDALKQGTVLNAFRPELSNGAVMDIGIYTVYPMIALFGRPRSLKADGIILSTGVDGQGTVSFDYPDMNATVMYSKIANSYLPSEIQGEAGNLLMDDIHLMRHVTYIPRPVAASGRGPEEERISVGVELDKDIYTYEMTHFLDLLQQGRRESDVNTLQTSLDAMEVIDEIRRQLGIVFPSDR